MRCRRGGEPGPSPGGFGAPSPVRSWPEAGARAGLSPVASRGSSEPALPPRPPLRLGGPGRCPGRGRSPVLRVLQLAEWVWGTPAWPRAGSPFQAPPPPGAPEARGQGCPGAAAEAPEAELCPLPRRGPGAHGTGCPGGSRKQGSACPPLCPGGAVGCRTGTGCPGVVWVRLILGGKLLPSSTARDLRSFLSYLAVTACCPLLPTSSGTWGGPSSCSHRGRCSLRGVPALPGQRQLVPWGLVLYVPGLALAEGWGWDSRV